MESVNLPEPVFSLLHGIERELLPELGENEVRFSNHMTLQRRVTSAINAVKTNGMGRFQNLSAALNELHVARSILHLDGGDLVRRLQYEPEVEGSDSRLDFCIESNDGRRCWMEVKTIQPVTQDDGELFQRLARQKRFPSNVEIVYEGDLWGEIFHGSYAARQKMLEYTIETEQRVARLGIDLEADACFLVFCGTGFDWTKDELEDFVGSYENRRHRLDDQYREMEAHFIEEKGIRFDFSLTKFGYLKRPRYSLHAEEIVWVVPPVEFS